MAAETAEAVGVSVGEYATSNHQSSSYIRRLCREGKLNAMKVNNEDDRQLIKKTMLGLGHQKDDADRQLRAPRSEDSRQGR